MNRDPFAAADRTPMMVAANGVEWTVALDGQHWRISWHPPADPPSGIPHGSAAICHANGQRMEDGYEPMYRRIFAEAARQDFGYGRSTGQEARP